MPATQMNLRIDAQLKERGDAALAQVGYSPSRTVRVIWEFAAAHTHNPQAVKDLLQQVDTEQDTDRQARVETKLAALDRALNLQKKLESAVGAAHGVPVNDISDRDLRGDALFSRWEDRGLV